jgi:hypothetical protein
MPIAAFIIIAFAVLYFGALIWIIVKSFQGASGGRGVRNPRYQIVLRPGHSEGIWKWTIEPYRFPTDTYDDGYGHGADKWATKEGLRKAFNAYNAMTEKDHPEPEPAPKPEPKYRIVIDTDNEGKRWYWSVRPTKYDAKHKSRFGYIDPDLTGKSRFRWLAEYKARRVIKRKLKQEARVERRKAKAVCKDI